MSQPVQIEPRPLVIADGMSLLLRQARPDDVVILADLIYHLSARSRYMRFMRPLPLSLDRAWAEARRMARQPPERHLTLVATLQLGPFEDAVAVAELARDPALPHVGEFAVLVRDDYQAAGVGSALAARLVELARAMGVTQLHSDMLAENRAVRGLLRRLGDARISTAEGFAHAVLNI
jgi:acetyltransferase